MSKITEANFLKKIKKAMSLIETGFYQKGSDIFLRRKYKSENIAEKAIVEMDEIIEFLESKFNKTSNKGE